MGREGAEAGVVGGEVEPQRQAQRVLGGVG